MLRETETRRDAGLGVRMSYSDSAEVRPTLDRRGVVWQLANSMGRRTVPCHLAPMQQDASWMRRRSIVSYISVLQVVFLSKSRWFDLSGKEVQDMLEVPCSGKKGEKEGSSLVHKDSRKVTSHVESADHHVFLGT